MKGEFWNVGENLTVKFQDDNCMGVKYRKQWENAITCVVKLVNGVVCKIHHAVGKAKTEKDSIFSRRKIKTELKISEKYSSSFQNQTANVRA